MTPKTFAGLWIAAIIAVFAAAWIFFANNSFAPTDEAGDPLLPQVIAEAKNIGGLDVTSAGETLALAYQNGQWNLPSRGDYPADLTKVRDLVISLAQMRTLERKTANPEKYSLLDLGDPAGKDAKSTQVTIKTKDGKNLTSIVLGRVKPGLLGEAGSATYVRLADNPQTWLVSGRASTSANIAAWVDTDAYKLDPQKITKISVAQPDGTSISLVKSGDEYTVPGAPDPTKIKDKQGLKLDISDYAVIQFTDVRKAKPGLAPVVAGTVEAGDVNVQVDVFKDAKEYWIAVKATGDSDAAKAINTRTTGWQYRIGEAKAKALNKTMVDFEKS